MTQQLKFIVRVVPRGFLYSTIDKLFDGFHRERRAETILSKIIDDWKIVQDKNFILGNKSKSNIFTQYTDKEISLIHILSQILTENLTNIDLDKRAAYLFDLKLQDTDNEYKLLESSVHDILEDTNFDNSFIQEYLRSGKFFDLSKISLRFIVDRKCFA